MKKIGLKPNGWFPFFPFVIPSFLIMWVVMALIEQRPVTDTWLRLSLVAAFTSVSAWAVSSWRLRKRDGWSKPT